MRKRTNWSSEVVAGMPQQLQSNDLNVNETNKSSGRNVGGNSSGLTSQQDRDQGWSEINQQGTNNNALGQSGFGQNTFGQNTFGQKAFGQGNPVNRGGRNEWVPADLTDKLSILGKISMLVIGIVVVVGIIFSLIKNGPSILAAFAAGVLSFFEFLMSIVIVSFLLWMGLLVLVGRFLPSRLKGYSLFIVAGLTTLCHIFPELGSALLGLLLTIGIFVFIIKTFIN